MNARTIAQIFGTIVLLLGVVGLFSGERQIAAMNVDLMLDVLRIVLGGYLLIASMRSEGAVRTALSVFGAVYLVNFITALVSPTAFGLLPDRYGLTDNILHLGGGLIALLAAGFFGTGRRAHHA